MNFVGNTVFMFNLLLCIIITVMGVMGYRNRKSKTVLYLTLAFGLFGMSNAIFLFEFGKNMEAILIIIRMMGYLFVLNAMYRIVYRH
jgi:uncharacterized membrane protein (UPF0136 family)